MLDIDGSGSLSIHEFCDGISRMATANQPMDIQAIKKHLRTIRSGQLRSDHTQEQIFKRVAALESDLRHMRRQASKPAGANGRATGPGQTQPAGGSADELEAGQSSAAPQSSDALDAQIMTVLQDLQHLLRSRSAQPGSRAAVPINVYHEL